MWTSPSPAAHRTHCPALFGCRPNVRRRAQRAERAAAFLARPAKGRPETRHLPVRLLAGWRAAPRVVDPDPAIRGRSAGFAHGPRCNSGLAAREAPHGCFVFGRAGLVRTVLLRRGSVARGRTDGSEPRHENVPGTLLPNLLPNSVARDGTRTDRGRFRDRISQTVRDVSGCLDTRRDGRDRISRSVPKPIPRLRWVPDRRLVFPDGRGLRCRSTSRQLYWCDGVSLGHLGCRSAQRCAAPTPYTFSAPARCR
jgi:hypothetical protein